jgi:hypothetical protein
MTPELEDREIEEISVDDARVLWIHVIRKAVEDYRHGIPEEGASGSKIFLEAEEWLFSEETEFPSFLFLCDYFEYDPGYIRRALHAPQQNRANGVSPTGVVVRDDSGEDTAVAEEPGTPVEPPGGEVGAGSDL